MVQAQEKRLIFRTDFLELRSTRLQLFRETEVTHLLHGSSLVISEETSSSSVRLVRVSTTESEITDSFTRLTGVLIPTVPPTSTAILLMMRTDGCTQHGHMMQPLTLVRFTSTVNLTGRVISAHHKEAEQSSLVDVTAEKLVTEASLMRSLSGTLHYKPVTLPTLQMDKSLPLLLMQTVTASQTHGRTSMQVTSLILAEKPEQHTEPPSTMPSQRLIQEFQPTTPTPTQSVVVVPKQLTALILKY